MGVRQRDDVASWVRAEVVFSLAQCAAHSAMHMKEVVPQIVQAEERRVYNEIRNQCVSFTFIHVLVQTNRPEGQVFESWTGRHGRQT